MPIKPPYSRSPITEAILDFQLEYLVSPTLDSLSSCGDEIPDEYPERTPLQTSVSEFVIDPQAGNSARIKDFPAGFAFLSESKQRIFQAKTDGFTFNHVSTAPGTYPGWFVFRLEAEKVWGIYKKICRPNRVRRIGLRYINRIDLDTTGPASIVKIQDFFRTYLELSSDLPQTMGGFFMQVVVPIPELRSAVAITKTQVKSPKPEVVSIILDLDLFRTEDIPNDETEFWSLIDSMRFKKNEVFEACITDKLREVIH